LLGLTELTDPGTSPMTHIRLGAGAEFDLIRRFLADDAGRAAGTAAARVQVGPGDDCAVLVADEVAITVDMSIEGVHFMRAWLEPREIGYRATAAALSDLAAMAAMPIGVLVALAVTAADAEHVATAVMSGCREAAADCNALLLGGDLTRSPGMMVIDVVAVGSAPRPVLRSGACPGDAVWVTGRLGGAAAAVRAWQAAGSPRADARAAFARPRPRLAEATWLAERATVTALIDLSDGLAGDAGHIAAASGVRIVLDAAAIPIHPAAAAMASDADDALRLALGGGEDYELCFTAAEGAIDTLRADFERAFGVQLARVGTVGTVGTAGTVGSVLLRDTAGRTEVLRIRGFDHLQGSST
jgi:thiamine-monophosphate kinase